jgi:hypothetical protein
MKLFFKRFIKKEHGFEFSPPDSIHFFLLVRH